MKDVNEVLRQKEAEFARVRKEVESLNVVARLLAEENDKGAFADLGDSFKKPSSSVTNSTSRQSDLQGKIANHPLSSAAESRLSWLNTMKIAK